MLKRLLLITGLAAVIGYFFRRRLVPAVGGRDRTSTRPRSSAASSTRRARRAEPEAAELSDDLDARRREVHERARASADEMRGSSSE